MLDSTVPINVTPDEMRAAARDLVTKADALEASTLQESGTRFWDIPGYCCRAQEGILFEQHEPGRPVEYRVNSEAHHNTVGSEWDSNKGEPKKHHIYPPQFAFKSIAAVRLVWTHLDDAGVELRRYVEVV